jgi:hypothetical protein
MRSRSLLRVLTTTTAVTLVTGVCSVALAAPSPAPAPVADPCAAPSLEAEPAHCAPAAAGADRGDLAPVLPGNAFADGLSAAGSGDTDKLTFPPGNMVAPQQVADELGGISIFGYDFSVDGSVLYGVDNVASTLITVDQSTGASTVVGPMAKTEAGHNWSDVVVDPVTGAAYASSGDLDDFSLYTLNLSTGVTTLVASIPTGALVIDTAINCAGQMFATTVGDDSLYSVNRATGALTLIGPTGVATNFSQGIDFDNATGILHAWLYQGAGVNAYSSINLTTGVATPFAGVEPLGEFEGAIRTGCAPPAVAVTAGPVGKTALLRPAFSFTTGDATTVQCSVDTGTPAFAACAGTSFQPATNLAPGSYTFRVRGTRGLLTAQATRAFIVVDCATLKANVAKAKKRVKKTKAKLKAAKATGDPAKIAKAQKKYKKAKAKRKAAKAALKAEPVCL